MYSLYLAAAVAVDHGGVCVCLSGRPRELSKVVVVEGFGIWVLGSGFLGLAFGMGRLHVLFSALGFGCPRAEFDLVV